MSDLREMFPWAFSVCEFVSMVLFFIALPIGFVLGSIWSGVRVGFKAGSEI